MVMPALGDGGLGRYLPKVGNPREFYTILPRADAPLGRLSAIASRDISNVLTSFSSPTVPFGSLIVDSSSQEDALAVGAIGALGH
jgi:hypothetical protein